MTGKITMKCTILKEDNQNSLEKDIAEYISKGWELRGGISIYDYGSTMCYMQTMIKNN